MFLLKIFIAVFFAVLTRAAMYESNQEVITTTLTCNGLSMTTVVAQVTSTIATSCYAPTTVTEHVIATAFIKVSSQCDCGCKQRKQHIAQRKALNRYPLYAAGSSCGSAKFQNISSTAESAKIEWQVNDDTVAFY